ncbi:expressed unknown protein [Seminavis robusta]|uniref:Exostosin GT47 domain-containing protein n=1 Tax=Seminavis robusta TaxID=568900 RepID=A0A9N8EMI7_9STRA|nr:expressed unknown protein [Seminavis robusta]|eukprot:Sro1264_g257340.1 n/a (548) ;mRNA; r:12279-14034
MARNLARKRLRAAATASKQESSSWLLFTQVIVRFLAVLLPALTTIKLLQQASSSTTELVAMMQSALPQSFESFPDVGLPFQTEEAKPQYKYQKYVELQDEIEKAAKENPLPEYGGREETSWSAFHRAAVVERAPWLPQRKMCKETCCVETVAISLDQDEHQLINTRDGIDLADLVLPYGRKPANEIFHMDYFAKTLDKAMIPCIVPGTIIGIENHRDLSIGFFHEYRPKIKVPYIISTTGSDGDSPEAYEHYISDPLLIKWYGTNPRYKDHPVFQKHAHTKFEPWNLGLSISHPQERNLLPYMKLNQFMNPFLDKSKWDLSNNNKLDFAKDVFVHFRRREIHRKKLWNTLCTSNVTEGVSCNPDINVPTHKTYSEMSQFRFGISPPGNGYDCYRTYEMLLLGVIPIVEERDILSQKLFEGMPVILMPKLTHATSQQEFVDAIESYIASPNFQNANFTKGWGRLFLKHKRQQMLKDSMRDREIVEDERGRKYYQAYRYSVVGPSKNIRDQEQLDARIAEWYDDPQPKFEPGEEDWLARWKDRAMFKSH